MRFTKEKKNSPLLLITAIILIFVLAFGMCVFADGDTAQTADHVAVVIKADRSRIYYNALDEAINEAEDGDTVALLQHVCLSRDDAAVTIDKNIILTSEGANAPCFITGTPGEKGSLLTFDADVQLYDIVLDGSKESNNIFYGPLITVEGGKLVLGNGAVLQNHKDNRGGSAGGGVAVFGGSLVMEDGSFISNCFAEDGGGVYITNAGEFVMNGGKITGCTAMDYGGGVYLGHKDAVFTMNDGIISGNQADSGGGILAEGGTFTMYDGMVTENEAEYHGGGLSMGHRFTGGSSPLIYAKTNIHGGQIIQNDAASGGGGIFVVNGDIEMSAGEISQNTTGGNGGGVSMGCHFDKAAFDMTGGIISENVATEYGGGVYFNGSPVIFNLSDGASISENQAKRGGGACLRSGCELYADGGSISENAATQYGGGIYYASNGLVTLKNGSGLRDNEAEHGGGAFMGTGRLLAYDSFISGNEATDTGGAIYCNGGQILLDSTSVLNNAAVNRGGIYSTPNTVVLIVAGNTVFSGNTGGEPVGNHIQMEYVGTGVPITIGQLGEAAEISINVTNYDQNNPSLLDLLVGIPRTLQAATDEQEAVYYTLTWKDLEKITVENERYSPSLEDDNKIYLKYTVNVVLAETEGTYNGNPHSPEVTVTDCDGNVMEAEKDYRLIFYDSDGKIVDADKLIDVGVYDIKIEPVDEPMANVWKTYIIKEPSSTEPDEGEDDTKPGGEDDKKPGGEDDKKPGGEDDKKPGGEDGTTPDDEGSTTPDEEGAKPDDEGGTTLDDEGSTTPDEEGAKPDDEGGTTPDDEGSTTPEDEEGAMVDDEEGAKPDDEGSTTPDDESGITPDDEGGIKFEDDGGTRSDNEGGKENKGVDTGDHSNLYLWVITALTAIAAYITTFFAWGRETEK